MRWMTMTVTPNIRQTLLWGDGTPGGPALTYPEAEPLRCLRIGYLYTLAASAPGLNNVNFPAGTLSCLALMNMA